MKNGQGKYKLCGQTERQENNPDPIFNDSVEVVSEAPYATGKIKLVVSSFIFYLGNHKLVSFTPNSLTSFASSFRCSTRTVRTTP